ncbi:TolC family protein [Tenacibaculum sp. nBUS_03]|uniref:TolC family protein n=1 Tax=Tenacibaculum sp. nBUS_03 TaxID=3395320 RepID=UPI003EC09926
MSVGQERWTLNKCVEYAIEHNLQIKKNKYKNESNREKYKQSYRNLLPSVRATSDYATRFGRSVDPNDNSISDTSFFINNYSLEASVDLFMGFQKLNAIKVSNLIYKTTEKETLQQKYLLALRVMQAFYDVQFLKGALIIAEEQTKVSQANYDLVKRKIELGVGAGADLYEAESILLTERLNVTTTFNRLAAAKLVLIQEMNLQNTTDIFLVEEITKNEELESSKVESDSVFKKAKSFIPIIKVHELKIEAVKKQLAIERGKLYPSLSLFGRYGTAYAETIKDNLGNTVSFGKQIKDNAFQVIGLSLNIPISTGWATRSSIKQQKIAFLDAKNDLLIQKQILFKTIQELVLEYHALQVEYKQTIKNEEVQGLAFTIAQKRYEKGMISSIELFTAKNLFANSQNQNLQVKLKLEVNRSTLKFYQGLPVFTIGSK